MEEYANGAQKPLGFLTLGKILWVELKTSISARLSND
nr:MAG TPA: hypothetical protein [Caudoviricetes sp.]